MRELPILMNGAMVRAILEGRKTVTRRLLKRQPEPCCHRLYEEQAEAPVPTRWTTDATGDFYCGVCGNGHELCRGAPGVRGLRSPYKVGDRLYVRETTMVEPHPSDYGVTEGDMPNTWAAACEAAGRVYYRADATEAEQIWLADARPWTPSIHMPKDRARIWLEVTDVRVERLQDITEEQARAEGAHAWVRSNGSTVDMREQFSDLWDGLAASGTRWADNPWVWVVEFKRIEKESAKP